MISGVINDESSEQLEREKTEGMSGAAPSTVRCRVERIRRTIVNYLLNQKLKIH